MAYMPIGPKTKSFAVPVTLATDQGDIAVTFDSEQIVIAREMPYPVAPVVTLYSPATTAYVKVTPNANNLTMFLRPTVTTETLQVTSILVHKIADATTITSDAPTTDETDRLRATEFKNDYNTHAASVAYHAVAGTAITVADATSDSTLIALTQDLDAKLKAHAASTTVHGGVGDTVFAAALAALALPAVPTKGECRTYLADLALMAAWTAHLAVTDLGTYITHPAGVMEWRCLGAFYAKTNVSAHTFATQEFRSS